MDHLRLPKSSSFPLISREIKFFLLLVIIAFVFLSGFSTPQSVPQSKKVLGVTTTTLKETAPEQKVGKKKPESSQPQQYAMVIKEEIVGKEYIAPTATPTPSKAPVQAINTESGYKPGPAIQIGPDTYTMKVQNDPEMASVNEVFAALNAYREKKGRSPLAFDEKLQQYAQSRADYFASRGDIDGHAGFRDLLKNQDGFTKLGFGKLGENSSWGYKLNGVHLIEWIYAGDAPHDDNQLNSDWTHVGIGVKDTSTDFIFGGQKR